MGSLDLLGSQVLGIRKLGKYAQMILISRIFGNIKIISSLALKASYTSQLLILLPQVDYQCYQEGWYHLCWMYFMTKLLTLGQLQRQNLSNACTGGRVSTKMSPTMYGPAELVLQRN